MDIIVIKFLDMVGAILNVEFLQTNKGGRQLIWNGYTYSQNNKRDTRISWKCVDKNCRATMCTRDDVPTKLGNAHNYLPDRDAVEGRTILSAIRFRAKTELTPI